MSNQNHTRTIATIYESFGRGDLDSILARCAEDVSWDNSGVASKECPWNGDFSGRARLPGFFKALAESLDFTRFEPMAFIEQGAQVAVHLRLEFVIRKNGRAVKNDVVHLWSLDGSGRVTRYRHFNDTAAELAAWRD